MQVQVLATDGGPHAPETWAMATARNIMPIGPDIAPNREIRARELQLKIADALVPHHGAVQEGERAALADRGPARLSEPQELSDAVRQAVDEVVAAAAGTPWEGHFADPTVQRLIAQEVGAHLATAADIERRWWRHRNPASDLDQASLAAGSPGAGANVA